MASQLKITLGGSTTLADENASPRLGGKLEQLGASAVVQSEKGYGAANLVHYPRGNVAGMFVFTVQAGYGTIAAALAAFASATALTGTQGSVVLTYGTTTFTMASAVLESVQRVSWNGAEMTLRYSFRITTITSP